MIEMAIQKVIISVCTVVVFVCGVIIVLARAI